jgi:hypothetical protein
VCVVGVTRPDNRYDPVSKHRHCKSKNKKVKPNGNQMR